MVPVLFLKSACSAWRLYLNMRWLLTLVGSFFTNPGMEMESSPEEKQQEWLKWLLVCTVATAWLCWYATPLAEWCLGAFVVWFVLARFDNAWAQAAGGTVFTYACGLVPAVVILLIFSNAPPQGAEAPVASIEELIVGLEERFSHWEKLRNVWVIVGILIALILVSRYHPRWKLIQRYSWLAGQIKSVSAIVAVARQLHVFHRHRGDQERGPSL